MRVGIFALLLYVILGAFVPILVKLALREIPPITLTFLRFFIATLIFFPFYWSQRPKGIRRSELFNLLLVGSLGGVFNVGLFAYGIQFTSVIMSQVFYALVPIIVAILGFFLIAEKINRYQITGAIIGFFGVLFLLYQSIISHDTNTLGTLFGNIIILTAAFAWAFYTTLSRGLSKQYLPITISFASLASGMVLLGFLAPIEIYIRGFSLHSISILGWLEVFVLAMLTSFVSYFLYQFGIKKTSAFIASLTLYLSPLAVVLPAMFFLQERVTILLVIGAALILLGVFLAVTYQQLKKNHKPVLQ